MSLSFVLFFGSRLSKWSLLLRMDFLEIKKIETVLINTNIIIERSSGETTT